MLGHITVSAFVLTPAHTQDCARLTPKKTYNFHDADRTDSEAH
jgi:hypothetical protein